MENTVINRFSGGSIRLVERFNLFAVARETEIYRSPDRDWRARYNEEIPRLRGAAGVYIYIYIYICIYIYMYLYMYPARKPRAKAESSPRPGRQPASHDVEEQTWRLHHRLSHTINSGSQDARAIMSSERYISVAENAKLM